MFGERLIHILIRKEVFCCLMIFFPLPEVETKRKEPLLKQKKGAVYIYIQSYRRGVCLYKKIALKAFFFLLLTNICSPEREAPRTRLEKAKKGSTMCSCFFFFFYHHALKELLKIFCYNSYEYLRLNIIFALWSTAPKAKAVADGKLKKRSKLTGSDHT